MEVGYEGGPVLVMVREQAIPGGVGETESPTVPEKPDSAVIVIVDTPALPVAKVTLDGVDEIAKSETYAKIVR